MSDHINVIGAGLAGCEAAWQAARRGVRVVLYEMKPKKMTPAHRYAGFAELVCSNSLRNNAVDSAIGLLKEELRRLGSLVMESAENSKVSAGGALAVDRVQFSDYITQKIKDEPLIEVVERECDGLPDDGITVIATGPLTSDAMARYLASITGGNSLSFFDAAAPIVSFDSIDMTKAFFASRYGKGSADYINCPMNKEQYETFYNALVSAETAELYGLQILEKDISTSGVNTTNFAVFSRTGAEEGIRDDRKFILMFTVNDVAGALADAINVISSHGFNMKALRSRPVQDRPWQYYFYVEAEGDERSEAGRQMLAALGEKCDTLKIVGHYTAQISIEEALK